MRKKPTQPTKTKIPKQKRARSLFVFCGILIVLAFLGYKILNEGIYYKQFSIAGIEVEGFYLKLENKFILDIQKIDLTNASFFAKSTNEKDSTLSADFSRLSIDFVVDSIQNVLFVLSYFEKLNIHSVILPDGHERKLLYDGLSYAVYGPNFEMLLKVENLQSKILLTIQTLRFYPFFLESEGYLEYYTGKKNLEFNLTLLYNKNLDRLLHKLPDYESAQDSEIMTESNPTISLRGSTNFKHLTLLASSSKLKDIKFLQPYIRMLQNKDLEEWLFKKISFSSFTLQSLDLQISLDKDIISNLQRSIKANALVDDPKIYLDSSLTPIVAEDAILTLRDENLQINFNKPTFANHNLADSSVRLQLPFSKPIEIFIALRSQKIALDKPLLDLLYFFNIDLPLRTQGGALKAMLDFHLKMNKKGDIIPNVTGEISAQESTLVFLGQKIDARQVLANLSITSKAQNVKVNAKSLKYADIADLKTELDIDILTKNLQANIDINMLDIAPQKIFSQNTQALPSYLDINSAQDLMTKNIIKAILEENTSTIPSILQINSPKIAQNVVAQDSQKVVDSKVTDFAEATKPIESTQETAQESLSETLQEDTQDAQKDFMDLQEAQEITDSKDLHPQDSNQPNNVEYAHEQNLAEAKQNSLPQGDTVSKTESKDTIHESSTQNTKSTLSALTLQGSFKDGNLEITIPKLSFSLKQDVSGALSVGIKDISALYAHSPLLQYYGISAGSVELTQNPATPLEFGINAKLSNLKYPIYDKNKKLLSALSVFGNIDISKPIAEVSLNTKDKSFSMQKRGNSVFFMVNDYDVNVDELLDSAIPILSESFKDSHKKKKTLTQEQIEQENAFIRQKRRYEREHNIEPHILYLESNNMQIFFGNYIVPTDSATITMRDGRINTNASYGNGIANVDIANGEAQITLNNFSANFINEVMQKKLFEGGLFDLSGILRDGILQGEVHMQNTFFKDFVLVQNILALIDTIPSLIVFKKPGLTNEGYEIKEGSLMFWLNNEYLGLDKINLIGTAIDVTGNGLVDLEHKSLDLLLSASTIKTFSDILSSIPIIGYLILGDDGKITTNIVVSGSLSDPKTEVSLLEDVVTAPFKILRRVFTPFDMISDALLEKKKETQK
ncbi:AsmA-like C-terminal domain-containing protein [Helicobacter himalayensis]|uniref:YhdP family protein n=1 Tax=Helicobacter himalayensis TaxID=1591088 RepID=UPI000834E206|nr:AsmA-like C-terminal domain-containing protein [Helicobacter himalayensis]